MTPRPSSFQVSVAVVLSLAFLAIAHPAQASCGIAPSIPDAIRDADTAFVGTVVELANRRRWATVEVGEVWKGEVGPLVEVRGGPADPRGDTTVVTSVDRHFREGVPYLFVPFKGNGEIFRDNACSVTTRYRPEMARFRPTPSPEPSISTDPQPQPTGVDLEPANDSPTWVLALVGVMVVGGFGSFLLLSKRRGR